MILLPKARSARGKSISKRTSILRSIYRTLAWRSLETYLLGAIAQHDEDEQFEWICAIEAIPSSRRGLVLCDRQF